METLGDKLSRLKLELFTAAKAEQMGSRAFNNEEISDKDYEKLQNNVRNINRRINKFEANNGE